MKKTILVVEDSASSRDLTVHFLQQAGYHVLEAEDGREALEVLKKHPVDLILTDIIMPNLDGWEFSRLVREDPRFAMTPFVFLSVLDDLEHQVKGLGSGVDDYLTKPITPEQLLARIQTALQRAERLKRFVYESPVTGAAYPEYFRKRLCEEADRARDFGRKLALVTFGIGNYLAIERNYADWFAQAVAEQAASKLKKHTRSYDTLGDFGLGRFAVILPERDANEARKWAEGVQQGWDLAPLWEETQQRVAAEIVFTVDDVLAETDPLALLDRRIKGYERKW